MSVSIECYTVGQLGENCYLLSVADRAVIIDPGEEAGRLSQALEGKQLEAIWLTHAHFDHVGALADLLDEFDAPVFMHPADQPLLDAAAASAARWGIPLRQPEVRPEPLADGQTLEFAGTKVSCLFTPGHAPGHIAFYLPTEAVVLSGDALFKGSIGRYDLPGADYDQLMNSLNTKLLTLPADTRVLPGHGPETSIGFERAHNPFLV